MSFGYPGDNLHLEYHGVTEESFWPSFTDVMMVIVMVFLLVTVAVILNNWTLIANLKESIKAQQEASHMAEDAQVENLSLEAKTSYLSKQLNETREAKDREHQKLMDTLAKLAKTEALVNELSSANEEQQALISETKKTLEETRSSLQLAQNTIEQKDTQLNEQSTQIAALTSQRDEKSEALEQLKSVTESKLTALAMLQTDRTSLENKLGGLQTEKIELEKQLTQANEKLSSTKIAANDAQAALQILEKENQEQSEALQRLEQEKQREITEIKARLTAEMNQKIQALKQQSEQGEKTAQLEADTFKHKLTGLEQQLTGLKKQLTEKDSMLIELQKQRVRDESQLLSLQGEYDTLDSKYQKLLRPARSSKGKHVVTVTYKKSGSKKTIRLKTGPNVDYKTVSSNELHKSLNKLKKKYKTDLYVKIIIPENSGLSYNEAWRFTSNLQRQYDYYYQPDSQSASRKAKKAKIAEKAASE